MWCTNALTYWGLFADEGVGRVGASLPGRGRGLSMMGGSTLPKRKTSACLPEALGRKGNRGCTLTG
ncbi:Uncharacterised protein [Mycobacterium tuberculosis]|uniref:Uncharacterized protein n=3 Tax=Mycobacterium tuberculosis TaxID=1773 RepID=A0A0U0RW36_MYCTX|nr:hypothetical protein [Mycobacterium tuberculosis]COV05037.1 Uncharacterised protein [Mycobacterium tuberculosis]COV96054.1 Uncharacterised protein [Mycobacterium tuberculosis]COW27306.1 Uncharacterised protein [Mycobacterium tuberculosis]COW32950.1 Uncharacterised protein [Mycobacterium tuberculosis]